MTPRLYKYAPNVNFISPSVIDAQLSKLLSQGVIMRAIYCKNQFISNIFTRPKNNGKYRLS